MSKTIYAIYDNVADTITGGLQLHAHDAPAIRMYSDIANLKDSIVGQHPADFDLIRLGMLHDDSTITPSKKVILTGAAWLASQQPRPNGEPDATS